MTRWERVIFGFSSILILFLLGIKLHELDMPAARFVRSFNIHAVNRIGDAIAIVGAGEVIAGAFAIIGILGWWMAREPWRQLGLRGVLAQAAVGAVSQILKHVIGRPRPKFAHADEFTLGPSMASGLDSFPSGHAINSFAAAAVVGWFLPRWRFPLLVVAGLVSISRVVRGSHFPTDIYAGAVLGYVIGSMVAAGMRRWREEVLPSLIRIGVPGVVLVFLVLWVMLHPVPAWSERTLHLALGAVLLVVGVTLRTVTAIQFSPPAIPPNHPSYFEEQRGRLQTFGSVAMLLGITTSCGPWWVTGLFLIALLPVLVRPRSPERTVAPQWRREAIVFTVAVMGAVVLLTVQGLLPIAF